MKRSVIINVILIFFLFLPAYSNELTIKCDVETLRVRKKPTIHSLIIGVIHSGEKFKVLAISKKSSRIGACFSKWYKINIKGKTGWVYGGYVSNINGRKKPFGIVNLFGEWKGYASNSEKKYIFKKDGTWKCFYRTNYINSEEIYEYETSGHWLYNANCDTLQFCANKESKDVFLREMKRYKKYVSRFYRKYDISMGIIETQLERSDYSKRLSIYTTIEYLFITENLTKSIDDTDYEDFMD